MTFFHLKNFKKSPNRMFDRIRTLNRKLSLKLIDQLLVGAKTLSINFIYKFLYFKTALEYISSQAILLRLN